MTGPITWYVNSRGMLEKALGRWTRIFLEPTTIPNFREGGRKLNGQRFGEGEKAAPLASLDEQSGTTREAVILVPFDFSECSLKAAKAGVSIARHTGGQLVFCHALLPKVTPFGPANPPWVGIALRHEAMEKVKRALEIARAAGVSATCEIQEGTPAGVILKVARMRGADLILLTAENHGFWSRLLFGPRTTEQVLGQAECHVMVLRNG